MNTLKVKEPLGYIVIKFTIWLPRDTLWRLIAVHGEGYTLIYQLNLQYGCIETPTENRQQGSTTPAYCTTSCSIGKGVVQFTARGKVY